MAEKFSIKAAIETDGKPLSVLELSNFLFYFRAAYVLGLRGGGLIAGSEIPADPRELYLIGAGLLNEHRGTTGRVLAKVAQTELEPWTDLQLVDIHRENPLKLAIAGVPLALALAVIFSGGKVDVGYGGFKAELPPLGTGIASIKDAFTSGQMPPAGAGPSRRDDPIGQKPKPKPKPGAPKKTR